VFRWQPLRHVVAVGFDGSDILEAPLCYIGVVVVVVWQAFLRVRGVSKEGEIGLCSENGATRPHQRLGWWGRARAKVAPWQGSLWQSLRHPLRRPNIVAVIC